MGQRKTARPHRLHLASTVHKLFTTVLSMVQNLWPVNKKKTKKVSNINDDVIEKVCNPRRHLTKFCRSAIHHSRPVLYILSNTTILLFVAVCLFFSFQAEPNCNLQAVHSSVIHHSSFVYTATYCTGGAKSFHIKSMEATLLVLNAAPRKNT